MKTRLLGNGDLYIDDEFEDGFNYVYILLLNNDVSVGRSKIKTSADDIIMFENLSDGYYSLCRLTIPTESYCINHSDTVLYYTDGSNFYKNGENGKEEVCLQEIVNCGLSIPKDYLGFFSTINLKKEYVSICEKILKNNFEYKCLKNKIDTELVYKRDLLRSAYDIIQYLIDYCRYTEAQQILDRITGCNGLYNDNSCNCNL